MKSPFFCNDFSVFTEKNLNFSTVFVHFLIVDLCRYTDIINVQFYFHYSWNICCSVFFKKCFCFILDTPGHGSGWAETPRTDRGGDSIGETPTPGASKRKSRWDETPASQMGGSTPVLTPGKTPIGTPAMNMATPTPGEPSSFPKTSLLYMKMKHLPLCCILKQSFA